MFPMASYRITIRTWFTLFLNTGRLFARNKSQLFITVRRSFISFRHTNSIAFDCKENTRKSVFLLKVDDLLPVTCRWCNTYKTEKFSEHKLLCFPPKSDVRIHTFNFLLHKLQYQSQKYGLIYLKDFESCMDQFERRGHYSKNNAYALIRLAGSPFISNRLRNEDRHLLVDKVWNRLKMMGGRMSVIEYNGLLETYSAVNYNYNPEQMIKTMQSEGVLPNRVSFQLFIETYCNTGDMSKAMEMIQLMQVHKQAISIRTYESLLMGFFNKKDVDGAKKLLWEMTKSKLKFTNYTYRHMMLGFAKNGCMESMFQTLESFGAKPNVLIQVIAVLVESGYDQYANKVVSLLEKSEYYGLTLYDIQGIDKLISLGQLDLAFRISMQFNHLMVMEVLEYNPAHVLMRLFVMNEVPVAKASLYIQKMIKKELENAQITGLSSLLIRCYLLEKIDYAIEVIKQMHLEGEEIKSHYFWPAVCQYRDLGDFNGMRELLNLMKSVNMTLDHEVTQTIFFFTYPKLRDKPFNIVILLQELNFPGAESGFIMSPEWVEWGNKNP